MNTIASFPIRGVRIKRFTIKWNIFTPLDFTCKHANFRIVIKTVRTDELHYKVTVKFQDVSEHCTRIYRRQLVRVPQNKELYFSTRRERLQERRKERHINHARFVNDVNRLFWKRITGIKCEPALRDTVFQESVQRIARSLRQFFDEPGIFIPFFFRNFAQSIFHAFGKTVRRFSARRSHEQVPIHIIFVTCK